jgi:phosphatidylserine/phosphatidylglycerophosphate/cardiolipin synthase-like enzyme
MIRGATRTLDLAEFYAVTKDGSSLEPVIVEIERALARGVRVRLLLDAMFFPKYPELPARMEKAGALVKKLDLRPTTGGILHAKYFVVDGREAFLGSQNLDWRALDHIQEIGARLREPAAVAAVASLFEADWTSLGRADAIHAPGTAATWASSGDVVVRASPRGLLPDEGAWDLPALVAWIDGARRSVDVQLLTYKPASRDGAPFRELDDALERASARGVRVRLLVSHWNVREAKDAAGLARLAGLRGVEVRVIEIPKWSGGEIEFARVSHAKYMVVDGARAWIGTSNWEGDYFEKSRNVSVFTTRAAAAADLARVFEDGWTSPYTRRL